MKKSRFLSAQLLITPHVVKKRNLSSFMGATKTVSTPAPSPQKTVEAALKTAIQAYEGTRINSCETKWLRPEVNASRAGGVDRMEKGTQLKALFYIEGEQEPAKNFFTVANEELIAILAQAAQFSASQGTTLALLRVKEELDAQDELADTLQNHK